MTRILYWNIQTFAFNKIADPANPVPALRRLLQILSNLGVNTPDIFVVVEVSTGGGPVGSPVTGAGANGSMELLALIRAAIPGNWFLVPPLISGTGGFAEGIAVYYNNATVNFTGPNVLRPTAAGPPISVTPPIPGGGVAAAYPAPWVGYAPAGGGPAINALPMGNNLAGKVRFHASPPAGAVAGVTSNPLAFPNLNNRSPFLTTFTEVGGAGRNITVIGFHSSPALAAVGTGFLIGMEELITPPTGNEVQVLVGDFNVRLVSALAPTVYQPFASIGFTQHVTLALGPAPAYSATHLQPWGGSSPVGVYPHYGYMNATDSLDNVFTRYGAAPGANVPTALLAPAAAAVGAIPPLPGPVVALIGGGGGGTTANIATAAAQEAGPVHPAAAAAVFNALGAIPALAALPIPAAPVQAAVDAIEAAGGAVPGPVAAALALGGPVAMPVAAAAAQAAAIERAGAEVEGIANAVSLALIATGLGGTPVAGGSPAAAAAIAAAGAAAAARFVAAGTVAAIGGGPNTTAANAAALARAAAGTGAMGLVAAAPVTAAVATVGAAGPAALAGAAPANFMIVNRVAAAPYGAGAPPAMPAYPSTLANPALLGMGGIGPLNSFRGWNNYRAIRSTSDHMALVIDV